MTAPTPPVDVEIGDVIGGVIREAHPPVPWWCNHFNVESGNLSECRELVASGRWVKVEKKETSDAGE